MASTNAATATNPRRRAALRYANRGRLVFPCHSVGPAGCSCGNPACEWPGKHPRIVEGVKGASCDPATIRQWWEKWPDSPIGLPTDTGFGVIGIDGPEAKRAPTPDDPADALSTADVLDMLDTAAPQPAAEASAKREARAAEAAGKPPAPEPFPVVRVLEGEAPEPPCLLVDDLLVDRDVNVWAGFGGAGKSVLALHLAMCVALGEPVFGTLEVRRSGPVLLVCPEDGQAAVRMMLDAIAGGLELSGAARQLLAERLVFVTDDSTVNLTADTGRLRETAKAHGAVLVILDPLRNLLGGGDENDNALAGACLDATRRDLCRDGGAAVLVNTHTRKPGKDVAPDAAPTMHEARGASAWVAGARLVFGVTNKAGHVTLTALKANRLRSDLKHDLRLAIDADPATPTRWRSCAITDANTGAHSESLTPGVGRDLNANERSALDCLDDEHEPGLRVSWNRWKEESDVNPNTLKSIKGRFLRYGLAHATPTVRKNRFGDTEYVYEITDKGRAALRHGWVTESPGGEGVRSGE